MIEQKYQCVSCAFYDKLEALATYYKKVSLVYEDEQGNIQQIKTAFKNFKTIKKAEFVILEDDSLLRLDKIKEVEEI